MMMTMTMMMTLCVVLLHAKHKNCQETSIVFMTIFVGCDDVCVCQCETTKPLHLYPWMLLIRMFDVNVCVWLPVLTYLLRLLCRFTRISSMWDVYNWMRYVHSNRSSLWLILIFIFLFVCCAKWEGNFTEKLLIVLRAKKKFFFSKIKII